jgi:hypothetical protein
MKTKKLEIVKDRWDGLVTLEISHNGWQTIVVNDLDIEDLKKLRKVIDEFIRNHENNSNKRW